MNHDGLNQPDSVSTLFLRLSDGLKGAPTIKDESGNLHLDGLTPKKVIAEISHQLHKTEALLAQPDHPKDTKLILNNLQAAQNHTSDLLVWGRAAEVSQYDRHSTAYTLAYAMLGDPDEIAKKSPPEKAEFDKAVTSIAAALGHQKSIDKQKG